MRLRQCYRCGAKVLVDTGIFSLCEKCLKKEEVQEAQARRDDEYEERFLPFRWGA